ncbi:MAG: heavy metal translocating P-type ATPase [Wenzhouxiangellaceae bacterium]|nr:heavy metal translocating P-type ATPase [Wenzhouxiangellaceae bacterium]
MPSAPETTCYHCGEPVPAGADLSLEIDGRRRPMCCAGCRAVASMIRAAGLGRYYDFRTELAGRPEREADPGRFAAWDRAAVLDYHAVAADPVEKGRRSLVLVLENVHCAACAWLVRRYLERFAGIGEARLDVSDGRLRLDFDPARTPLSTIAAGLEALGYPPHLDAPGSGAERDRNERRRMLKYLIVAALGMMQVMSYALAGYLGAAAAGGSMDPETGHFFRLVSMLVAVPVALYAGQPFYRSALAHLARGHLGIDVPVAAAILLALFSSVALTLFGDGEVYFDSVVMFIFFLLLGRFAVMLARQQSGAAQSALARALPARARRLTASGSEDVGLVELSAGDRVLVADGEVVPADGEVESGNGRVDEALISGESEPRARAPGDPVLAGSLVTGGGLTVRVTATGRATVLSGIVDLLGEARRRRPRLARLADRVAGGFIVLILVASAIAALAWWQIDPARVIPVVLSMLVVACPCALALGTPTALAAATRGLAADGVLTANPDALEAVPRLTHVVLDKTGTLTGPAMRIAGIEVHGGLGRDRAIAICAALERVSTHPIARAFEAGHESEHSDTAAGAVAGIAVQQPESLAGAGVSGVIDGVRYWLGRPDWVSDRAGIDIDVPENGTRVVLAGGGRCAVIRLEAAPRRGGRELIEQLQNAGVEVVLASGDREAAVAETARGMGIAEYHAGCSPDGKLALIRRLQRAGGVVAMLGDGINDAPVLAGADVSIALAEGAAIARTQADLVVTGRDLHPAARAFELAPRVRRIVRQNLGWALAYNAAALPLAAIGLIPPWAAAIGMSLSSLGVVLNARRLGRARGRTPGAARTGFSPAPEAGASA